MPTKSSAARSFASDPKSCGRRPRKSALSRARFSSDLPAIKKPAKITIRARSQIPGSWVPNKKSRPGFISFPASRNQLFSRAEHLPVVAVPVALKYLLRIIAAFEFQELFELRITALDLFPGRVFVVSEIVISAVLDGQINERTKA